MNRKGLTLIEVMITCVLLVVLFGMTANLFFSMMRGGSFAENLLDVNYHTQQVIHNITTDIMSSSQNPDSIYKPRVVGDELRFKIVKGFNLATETAVYTDYWICYWYDTANKTVVRRFRNDSGQLLTSAPAEFAGSEAQQVIASYITNVSWSVDPQTVIVTISVTASKGSASDGTDATVTKNASVRPENTD
ncbi:MAG: prepilin-type N-terminal cleavage/methylation domain-containing protein [Planctomycetota bacterium]|nr:prepilin-type N-terminal cleavage/methylation domain-containing protein [Planctomycetota bacterium]